MSGLLDVFIKFDQNEVESLIEAGKLVQVASNVSDWKEKDMYPKTLKAYESTVMEHERAIENDNVQLSTLLKFSSILNNYGLWFYPHSSDNYVLLRKEKDCYTILHKSYITWWREA